MSSLVLCGGVIPHHVIDVRINAEELDPLLISVNLLGQLPVLRLPSEAQCRSPKLSRAVFG